MKKMIKETNSDQSKQKLFIHNDDILFPGNKDLMITNATYFGANGWLIEFSSLKILIDPWLRGDLTFDPAGWIIRGQLKEIFDTPKGIDLILLTQGLPDHTHRETLKLFDLNTPIIGSENACRIVKEIGFINVKEIKPGNRLEFRNIEIMATKGAPIPAPENGYIIKSSVNSIYIEPHGFVDESIEHQKIDIVISPVVNIGLPFIGSFIKGEEAIRKLDKLLEPKYLLSSTIGGKIAFKGLLGNLINQDNIKNDVINIISDDCIFIEPIPGKRYKLEINI